MKICKNCGKEFTSGVKNKVYCSSKCRDEFKKKDAKTKRETELRERNKKNKMNPITEIQLKASKLGLSYGEYVAKYL